MIVIEIRRYMAFAAAMRLWCLGVAIAGILSACSTGHSVGGQPDEKPAQSSVAYANCILPGQLRQLGTRLTYLTPRQPVELGEQECRSRGGQFIVAEQIDPQPILAAGGEVEIRWGNETRPDDATVYSVAGEVVVSDND